MHPALLLFLSALLLFCCDTKAVKKERFFNQGNEALANKNYEKAIHYFNNAIRLDNGFASAYNNRGVAKLQMSRPTEAIQDYNEAIKINPRYFECIGNRAYAYEKINRFKSSLEDWSLLIGAFPDSLPLYLSKGSVEAKARKFDDAIASFEHALLINSESDDVLVNLGIAHFYSGNTRKAENMIVKAIDINPYHAHAYNALNQINIRKQDYETALGLVNQALDIEPENPFFINNKGFNLLMLDSIEAGLALINQSILLDGQNMWAYRNKGIYYLKRGDSDLAIRYFRDVLNSKAFVEEVNAYMGLAYQTKGELKKACESWEKGISKGDTHSERLFHSHCK